MSFDLNVKYNFCDLYDFNKKWFHLEKKVFIFMLHRVLVILTGQLTGLEDSGTYNIGFGTKFGCMRLGINLPGLCRNLVCKVFSIKPLPTTFKSFGAALHV